MINPTSVRDHPLAPENSESCRNISFLLLIVLSRAPLQISLLGEHLHILTRYHHSPVVKFISASTLFKEHLTSIGKYQTAIEHSNVLLFLDPVGRKSDTALLCLLKIYPISHGSSHKRHTPTKLAPHLHFPFNPLLRSASSSLLLLSDLVDAPY